MPQRLNGVSMEVRDHNRNLYTKASHVPVNLVASSGYLTIDALQSDEKLQLLNEIGKLRACGISDFVALPQLVVCGDQSSRKGSALEVITEVPFPRKGNLCTFATEIVLRKSSIAKVAVTTEPRKGGRNLHASIKTSRISVNFPY